MSDDYFIRGDSSKRKKKKVKKDKSLTRKNLPLSKHIGIINYKMNKYEYSILSSVIKWGGCLLSHKIGIIEMISNKRIYLINTARLKEAVWSLVSFGVFVCSHEIDAGRVFIVSRKGKVVWDMMHVQKGNLKRFSVNAK